MAFRKIIKFKDSIRALADSNTIGNIFTTGGNIGIGITAPSSKLDIDGDINLTGTLYQNSAPFSTSQWTGSVGSTISYTSGNVIANTATFTTGGNVGIGTTSPSVKLDVSGAVRITNGSLIATSNNNTIGPIITTFTDITFANLVPITSGLFAYYNGSSWTGTQWNDLTTNGNHATTIGGTINTTTENSITYLYGGTTSRIRFPTSVLPNTYTFFHVAKYNGNAKERIFDGITNNWLSGFWDYSDTVGNSGVAYHNQGFLGPISGVTGSNNFLLSSDQRTLYRANGSVVGVNNGDTTHLSINWGTEVNTESSDWAVSEIIVYNRELTTDEIERTESWLMDKYSAFTFTTALTYSTTHTAGTVTLDTFGNVGLYVGVSNTAPSYTLDVNGDLNFTGDLYQNGTLFGGGQWTGSVGSAISYTSGTVIMTNASVANITATNILINQDNASLTIKSKNENQISTLYLGTPNGNGLAYKSAIIAEGISNWSRSRLHFCLNNETNNDASFSADIGDSRMTILPDGNVGIGNTAPSYDLDVTGDVNFTGTLYQNGSPFSGGGGSSQWTGSVGSTISYTSGNVIANTATFTTGGNVGIGNTAPSYDLDVTGDVNFTGTLYKNGDLFETFTYIEKQFPEIALTSNSSSNCVASSSTVLSTFEPWKAFDRSGSSDSWFASNGGLYNTITGNYTGSVSTTVGGVGYLGEWIQIQLPSSILVSKYNVVCRAEYAAEQAPNTWILAGSTNGTTWDLVDQQSSITNWSSSASLKTFESQNSGAYNYFRMICTVSGQTINAFREYFVLGDLQLIEISSDINYTSGNVGIGTTAPSFTLDVNGTIGANAITTGALAATNISVTNLVATNETVVNLITTFETVTNLLIADDIRVTDLTSSNSNLTAVTAGGITVTAGGLIATFNSNTLGNIFTTGGNVGIGNTSPGYTLDVSGVISSNTGSVSNGNLILSNNAGGGVVNFIDVHHSIWGREGYNGVIDRMEFHEFGIISFFTGGFINQQTERMTITSNGNVGIGTTSPSFRLDVNGTFEANNTSGVLCFASTGNVGIGTTSPSQIFQVGDAARLRISNGVTDYTLIGTKTTDDGNNTRIVISGQQRGGNAGHIEYVATTTGSHIFYNQGVNVTAMTIVSSGNVGIGTASPSAQLHVSGTSKFGSPGNNIRSIRSFRATLGSGGSGTNNYLINYGVTYSDASKLIINVTTSNEADNGDTTACCVRTIGTSSFRLNVYRVDSLGSGWGNNIIAMVTITEIE